MSKMMRFYGSKCNTFKSWLLSLNTSYFWSNYGATLIQSTFLILIYLPIHIKRFYIKLIFFHPINSKVFSAIIMQHPIASRFLKRAIHYMLLRPIWSWRRNEMSWKKNTIFKRKWHFVTTMGIIDSRQRYHCYIRITITIASKKL